MPDARLLVVLAAAVAVFAAVLLVHGGGSTSFLHAWVNVSGVYFVALRVPAGGLLVGRGGSVSLSVVEVHQVRGGFLVRLGPGRYVAPGVYRLLVPGVGAAVVRLDGWLKPVALSLGSRGRGLCACIYYGPLNSTVVEWLSRCRLVVLPPTAPRSVVERLRGDGVVVLGYVSIATVGGWEPWAGLVNSSIVVGGNPAWGEKIVDACSPAWERILLDHALPYIVSKGFQGFMFDNLDVADKYPWMRDCIARLVGEARQHYHEAIIMVNRGFTVLPRIAPYIDFLLFEDFLTYYDAGAGAYRFWSGGDLEWEEAVLANATGLAEKWGYGIVLLAYAPPGDEAFQAKLCGMYNRLGMGWPLYVAPWPLQAPGLCNPCR